jgi:UDP:flavonoid glycosyltransferase YjiC (YdhE family)
MVTMVAAASEAVPSASVFHPAILEATSPRMLLTLLAQWARTRWLIRRAAPTQPVPPSPFGDLSLIPGIPELVRWPWLLLPAIVRRKHTAIHVGALLAQDPGELPPPAELREELGVPAEGSFVFGTVGGAVAQERYLEVLARGLEAAGVYAVLSAGSRASDAVIERLSGPRVRLVRSVPDDLRALRAADAFLWHGGHETMLAGVACARPAVGVPVQFDQDTNSRALEEIGAGVRVPKRELGPERVADAVKRVLADPSYRLTAGRLAQSSRRAGGARRVVDLLEGRVAAPATS